MSRLSREEQASLVRRCLDGDGEAWKTLFNAYQPFVLAKVARLTGRAGRNAGPLARRRADCQQDVLEEVACRVWLSLLGRDRSRLRAFDPSRGSLATFFGLRAAQEWYDWLRRQHARSMVPLVDEEERLAPSEEISAAEWQEVCAGLTVQERRYLGLCLGEAGEGPPLSDVNARQLRHRVLAKFTHFLTSD
jgi:DNA-directed RNA polymerase specialized sigma24 family protein